LEGPTPASEAASPPAVILITGDGVAAHCCAHLLISAGCHVAVDRRSRPKLPALLIGKATQALFGDVFGRSDLLRDAHRIRKRAVLWGHNSPRLVLDHSAAVISEQSLVDSIETKSAEIGEAAWHIFASSPLPAGSIQHDFGSRNARASKVGLKEGVDCAACYIESLEAGWLFLIPDRPGSGWLLNVGESGIAQSRMIAELLAQIETSSGEFPAHPRIAWPLCGTGWLACGTAALAFDPLCGDGTGQAIREAILASAVIRAGGPDTPALLDHYERRLVSGFKRHLAISAEYYRTGGTGPWWISQLDSIEQGLHWCDARLQGRGDYRYRLRGFDLIALE
jgi:hypothetical protein